MAELKRLLIVVTAGICGIALMVLLGFIFAPVISVTTLLGISVFCYFATGLIAGAWTHWRGAFHGALAAMLVFFGNTTYGFVIGITYGLASPFLVPEFLPIFLITGFFFFGIGALGGFVGERIRR